MFLRVLEEGNSKPSFLTQGNLCSSFLSPSLPVTGKKIKPIFPLLILFFLLFATWTVCFGLFFFSPFFGQCWFVSRLISFIATPTPPSLFFFPSKKKD